MRLLSFGLVAAMAGCASAPPAAPPITLAPGAGVVGAGSAAAIARADVAAAAYTPADVDFMQGMIPHHAQAVVVGNWCPERTERSDLRALCLRIVISQQDEIRLMRRWLAERGEIVPDSTATRHLMRMGDTVHEMLMPGMLTDPELEALERARGTEFERRFLEGMIRHHEGAITMAQDLFSHPGAAQEATVFRFASDVIADQSSEIERMLAMLDRVP
jgi:uncharacterized protein (DUF305 family)